MKGGQGKVLEEEKDPDVEELDPKYKEQMAAIEKEEEESDVFD